MIPEVATNAAGSASRAPRRGGDGDRVVALLTPTGGDAAVTSAVLARAGLSTLVCADMAALCSAVRGEAGVLLVAEEALAGAGTPALLAALAAQPAWSDIPVVLLTGEGELSRDPPAVVQAVTARANVTLLERPIRVATLVTTLKSALRARRRQFDVRDYLVERSAAERALDAARAEAEAANRSKGDFLAVMSHELRTPLNAIGGYAQLMAMGIRGAITDEQREDLARIQRSQRHLLGLVNEVLNYAKIETGALHYEMVDVVVRDALVEAEGLIAPQAHAKKIMLRAVSCAGDLRVRADPEKLRQILVNLLSNAVKFTESGGVVDFGCDATADRVALRVRDTGVGIPPEKLEAVFEPFVQVDQRLTRAHEGTGLGLTISRDLARAMGGDLTAESTPGVGSTFVLVLPRA